MHTIEPYFKWREYYIASEDNKSPFYERQYNAFSFCQKIYNYYIHPQWDDFGSQTMYTKVLYADYTEKIAMIELIGEWNDCLHNDIMFLKRELIDQLLRNGIVKFIVFCDNVLNFHGDDDSYYEEWYEDVSEERGWIAFVNVQDHVLKEMESNQLQFYINLGDHLNDLNWRLKIPDHAILQIEYHMNHTIKQLKY